MKVSFTGLPGSGKSTKLAQVAIQCLNENLKIKKKWNKERTLHSNMMFRDEVEDHYNGNVFNKAEYRKANEAHYHADAQKMLEEYNKKNWNINYWSERAELVKLRDCDLIIDEEQLYFDAQEWEMMSREEKRFFQQHRRYGVDIYGASQDFAQVDKSIRRVTSSLYLFTKVVGSRDISSTRPDPKLIWGISLVREADPQTYDEIISKMPGVSTLVSALIIRKKWTRIFDTREEIMPSAYPPLQKIVRVCPEDGFRRVKYVWKKSSQLS